MMRKNANKNLKLWLWIILLVLLQGCGTSPVVEDKPTPVVTPSVLIPTNSPTKTVIVLPTATKTIAPTTTPTVFPTQEIPEAEIKAYWQNIVATNGGCDLPCFLGIHPGEADWGAVEKLYEPVEDVSMYKPESSVYMAYPWYELPSLCLSRCDYHDLQQDIQEEAGIITSISARTEMIGQDPEIAKALEAYRLDNILAKYGDPSRVWLRLVPFPNHKDVKPSYFLTVFYDDQGILVDYWGEGVTILGTDKSVARVCPSFEKLIVFTLFLQSSDDNTTLEDLTIGTEADLTEGLPGLNLKPRPIETVTDLSISDFYNRLQTPGACFDSPTGIWK